MKIVAAFLILASAFTALVATKAYNAHTEQQQQEQEKKSLRQQIKERECRLMFPAQQKYYQQCVGREGVKA